MDEHKEVREKELEALYARWTPEERRRRVILEPAFRDEYNKLVEAHRIVPVPNYFWEMWLPVLGPVACALYIQLRRYCYHNAETGEKRETCWPKQDTLAREIGVKDPKTVRKGLVLLESHGFIQRERTKYIDRATGRPHRGSDKYRVFFEVPLVAEDAAELLIRQTTPPPSDYVPKTYSGKISLNRPAEPEPVDNSPYSGKISLSGARENLPSRTSTRTITKNVANVIDSNRLETESSERTAPKRPAPMPPEERERVERLAFEMGESLSAMGGSRSGGQHHSFRFHVLLASRLPESLIRTALMATRDAVEAHRSGRKTLGKDPSAYFAGISRNLASDQGLEFPAKRHPKPAVSPSMPRPTQPAHAAAPVAEADDAVSREEVRARIAELVAKFGSGSRGR